MSTSTRSRGGGGARLPAPLVFLVVTLAARFAPPASVAVANPLPASSAVAEAGFRQEFDGAGFRPEDAPIFESLYRGYAAEILPLAPPEKAEVEVGCEVVKHAFLADDDDDGEVDAPNPRVRRRRLREAAAAPTGRRLIVDYTVTYASRHHDVTTYPELFRAWIDSNLDGILGDMRELRLNVTRVEPAERIAVVASSSTAASGPPATSTAVPTTTTTSPPIAVRPATARAGPSFGATYVATALLVASSMLGINLLLWSCRRDRILGPDDRRRRSELAAAKAAAFAEDPEGGSSRAEEVRAPPPEAFGALEAVVAEETRRGR